MRLSLVLSSLAGFLGLSSSGTPATPPGNTPRQPVVVELFTSEGCSDCPPADALLQKLDREQPVPGAMVIVLSEHVDYWDHLGWRDPFSSAVFSRRQEAYGRRLHLDNIYTPQVVIDGTSQALGSDARQVQDAVRRSIKGDKVHVQISQVFKGARGVPTVHVQIDPPERPEARGDARLMLALAENAVVSHVLRGENSGRKLDHVAVVLSLIEFGRLNPAGPFSADIPLTRELEHWNGKRLIAFVQSQPDGRILGADLRVLPQAVPN